MCGCGYADADADVRMRSSTCIYGFSNAEFFMELCQCRCTEVDAQVKNFMCGWVDSVADMRMHMRICIHRIRIHRYEIADTGFHKWMNRYGCPYAYVYLDVRMRMYGCGCRDANLISILSIYFIFSKPHANILTTECVNLRMRMCICGCEGVPADVLRRIWIYNFFRIPILCLPCFL